MGLRALPIARMIHAVGAALMVFLGPAASAQDAAQDTAQDTAQKNGTEPQAESGAHVLGRLRIPAGSDPIPPFVVSIRPPADDHGQPVGKSDKATTDSEGAFDFGLIAPRSSSLGIYAWLDPKRDCCLLDVPARAIILVAGETHDLSIDLPFTQSVPTKISNAEGRPVATRLFIDRIATRNRKPGSMSSGTEPAMGLWATRGRSADFGGDGAVWFAVGEGDFALQAVAPGYRTGRRIVRITKGDRPQALEITLEALPAAWRTRLVDATSGAPLRNVEVSNPQGLEQAMTDGDGVLTVDFLPPGVYRVDLVFHQETPRFVRGVELDLSRPAESLEVRVPRDRR